MQARRPGRDARLAIALALADGPNAPTYVRGERNKQDSFRPIHDLVAEDEPFFVVMKPEVLGIDFDSEGCEADALETFLDLRLRGVDAVLVASGGVADTGEHHRHVWAVARTEGERVRWEGQRVRGDVRRGSRKLRPPGGRRWDGLARSTPLLPVSMVEVVRRLTLPQRQKPIPAATLQLIKEGAGYGADRSKELTRVVQTLRIRGWGEDEVWALLTCSRYGVARMFSEATKSRDYEELDHFRLIWDYVVSHAHADRQGEVDRRLRRFRRHGFTVILASSQSKARATLIAVFDALVRIGERAGKERVDASIRTLRIMASVASNDTIAKALNELEELGLIANVTAPAIAGADRRSLRLADTYALRTEIAPAHLGGVSALRALGQPTFRDSTGLGKWAGLAYEVLSGLLGAGQPEPVSLGQLVSTLNIAPRRGKALLEILASAGLAVRLGDRWGIGGVVLGPEVAPAAYRAVERDLRAILVERQTELKARAGAR